MGEARGCELERERTKPRSHLEAGTLLFPFFFSLSFGYAFFGFAARDGWRVAALLSGMRLRFRAEMRRGGRAGPGMG